MVQKRKTYQRHNISETGPNPVDTHVGQKLRTRRNLVGMTQQEMAEATNITFQQVQKYETGKNRTSASRLYQFSRLLGTSIDFFFEGLSLSDTKIGIQPGFADNKQDNYEPSNEDDIMAKKETIDLVRTYYAIPDEKLRKDFLKMMKQLAKTEPEKPARKTAKSRS